MNTMIPAQSSATTTAAAVASGPQQEDDVAVRTTATKPQQQQQQQQQDDSHSTFRSSSSSSSAPPSLISSRDSGGSSSSSSSSSCASSALLTRSILCRSSTGGSTSGSGGSGKRTRRKRTTAGGQVLKVRFNDPEMVTLIVPPEEEPYTADEKRSAWYTGKELQSKHQNDIDQYTDYLSNKSLNSGWKRHSTFISRKIHHQQYNQQQEEDDGPRRQSAPADCTSGGGTTSSNGSDSNNNSDHHHHHHDCCWRGLEHHKIQNDYGALSKTTTTTKRTERVKEIIHEIVSYHHELTTTRPGLPLFNDELRRAYQKRTRGDKLRAEKMALADAKDALGKIEVVKDLITHKHTTLNKSPARQFRKVGMLAKMGVSGVVGCISIASF